MSTVEHYDPTGKYPEKAQLEQELKEVEDNLSKNKSLLRRSEIADSFDAGFGVLVPDSSHKELEQAIMQLEAHRQELMNALFRIAPSEER